MPPAATDANQNGFLVDRPSRRIRQKNAPMKLLPRVRAQAARSLHGLLVVLAASMAALSVQAADGRRKVIVDDDGFSLMQILLLEAPDVDVLGLTTVSGDFWANRATAYALRGVEILGRTDVPVARGATYPLLNSEAATERWEALYGKLTWKGAWMKAWVEPTLQALPDYHGPDDPVHLPWGDPVSKARDEIAANFLIRMAHQYPGEITIIEGGPMTNLALAQRLDPEFSSLIKELVFMGGSFNPHQVLTDRVSSDFAREYANSPRREFNIRFDPEAARIVLRSPWRKITAVPVDPSTATQLSPALLARLAKVATPDLAALIAKLTPGFPLWDESTAAVWLDPSLVTERETLFIDVNTAFDAGYGDMQSWRPGYEPGLGEQKAEVVRAVDPRRLEEVMVRRSETGVPRK